MPGAWRVHSTDVARSAVIMAIGQTLRRRLPNRRRALTQAISFVCGNGEVAEYLATAGLDELGRAKEIFLFGAKDGTDMASVLADTAVVVSVALQSGIAAKALGVSVSRVLQSDGSSMPASVVGAALDFLASLEGGES